MSSNQLFEQAMKLWIAESPDGRSHVRYWPVHRESNFYTITFGGVSAQVADLELTYYAPHGKLLQLIETKIADATRAASTPHPDDPK